METTEILHLFWKKAITAIDMGIAEMKTAFETVTVWIFHDAVTDGTLYYSYLTKPLNGLYSVFGTRLTV